MDSGVIMDLKQQTWRLRNKQHNHYNWWCVTTGRNIVFDGVFATHTAVHPEPRKKIVSCVSCLSQYLWVFLECVSTMLDILKSPQSPSSHSDKTQQLVNYPGEISQNSVERLRSSPAWHRAMACQQPGKYLTFKWTLKWSWQNMNVYRLEKLFIFCENCNLYSSKIQQ